MLIHILAYQVREFKVLRRKINTTTLNPQNVLNSNSKGPKSIFLNNLSDLKPPNIVNYFSFYQFLL